MLKTTLDQLLANLDSEIWQKIAQIDELKGQWIGGARLDPQLLSRLKKSVLVTSTGASTRIEGAKLTDEDIEKMMRGITIQQFEDRDRQEVKGYFELLSNVFDAWQELHFSESLIKHFHFELLKYVEKDSPHRGEYKLRENKVHMVSRAGKSVGVLFDTTSVHLTPIHMHKLVDETRVAFQGNYHPLLVIGGFVVKFLQIHPFQDGNGRLSRILTNLLLLEAGYNFVPYVSHEKIIEDNKTDYYLALRSSQVTLKTKQPTVRPWLEFFLGVILEQSKQAVGLMSSENLEKLLSPTQLKVWQYLQSVDQVAPKEMAEKLSIPRPTINQVMDKLMRLQRVERTGQGRAVRYRVIR